MVPCADSPRLTSDSTSPETAREAVLEYRDGRTRRVPVCEPAPITIIECAAAAGVVEPGYERGQRRFGSCGADRWGTLRYVESEVLMAAFRCGACGCAAGLVYLPRVDEIGGSDDALPTSIAGVRWQLCWPCYAAWARTAPARSTRPRRPSTEAHRSRHATRRPQAADAWLRSGVRNSVPAAMPHVAGDAPPPAVLKLKGGAEEIHAILREADPHRLVERGAASSAYADQALVLSWGIEANGGVTRDELPRRVARAFGWAAGTPPEELSRAYSLVAERIASELASGAGDARV